MNFSPVVIFQASYDKFSEVLTVCKAQRISCARIRTDDFIKWTNGLPCEFSKKPLDCQQRNRVRDYDGYPSLAWTVDPVYGSGVWKENTSEAHRHG